ncbi:hypothetical protein V502_02305 [Pseudogymnoascus sp. VKM F-4520 (FW-2644)]|nr:hypothetical protein V502_02305 [Pseudogymnoascus sp. VKM F-4520 (FW-2644)]
MANVSHGCELMLQPTLEQTLYGVEQFRVVYDSNRNPIIFSLNNKGKLIAIGQDVAGESKIIDVSSQIGLTAENTVVTFALSQDNATLQTYLVCVSTLPKSSATRLHVFQPFKPSDLWTTGSKWLSEMSSTETTVLKIRKLLLSTPVGPTAYPFLAAVVTYDGKLTKDIAHIEIDQSSWQWSWSHDLTFPFNIEDMVDFCVGNIPTGSGVFAIHKSQEHTSLTFVGLSTDTVPRSPIVVTLPVIDGAQSLATTIDPLGFTNVLVGGNGILHIAAQDAVDSVPQGTILEPTIKSEHLKGLEKLHVAQDGDNVVVWAQNEAKNLIHQRCEIDSFEYQKTGILHFAPSSEAVPLLPGKGNLIKFDALTDSNTKGQKLYVLKDDGSVTCMTQAGDSLLWNSQIIRVPDPEDFEEVPTYTSHVRLTSNTDKPLTTKEVTITSSSQCQASINGQFVQLGQQSQKVELDENFCFDIVVQATDLNVPTFTISSFGEGQTYSFQAATRVVDKLSAICASGKLNELRKPDGSLLVSPSANTEDIEKASESILALQKTYNSLANPSTTTNLADSVVSETSAGTSWDFWHGVTTGIETIVSWVYEGGVWIVKTAKRVWKFVVETCEQALKAMGEALSWIGAKLEELALVLAEFLDWESILQTKAYINKVTNLGIGAIIELVANTGNVVDDFLYKVEKEVGTWHLPPILPSELDHLKPNDKKKLSKGDTVKDNPLFNWGFNQMKTNSGKVDGRHESQQGTGLIGILESSWNDHIKPLGTDIEAMMKTLWDDLKKLFDPTSDLTWKDGLKNIGADLVMTLVKIFRRLVHLGFDVVMKLIEWLQDLLNAPLQVPLISHVYKKMTGNDLSVIDFFSLIWAIPTTYVCKWLIGKKPAEIPGIQALLAEINYKTPVLKFNRSLAESLVSKSDTESAFVVGVAPGAVAGATASMFTMTNSVPLGAKVTSSRMMASGPLMLTRNTEMKKESKADSTTFKPSDQESMVFAKGATPVKPPPKDDDPDQIVQNSNNWKELRRWFRLGFVIKDALALVYTLYDTIATGIMWPFVLEGSNREDLAEMLGNKPKWKAFDVLCAIGVCLIEFPLDFNKSSVGGRVVFWLCTSVVNVWKSCMPGPAKVPLAALASCLKLGGYIIILTMEGIADGKVADSALEISHSFLTSAWCIGSAYNGLTGAKEPYGLVTAIVIGVAVDVQAGYLAYDNFTYWQDHGYSQQYEPPSWSTTLSGSFEYASMYGDQFLEHLIEIGIEKIIRIGGQSKSKLLEGKNLRVVSQGEAKTKSERYLVAKSKDQTGPTSSFICSGDIHVFSQFSRFDEDGFKTVGKEPFEVWNQGMKGENINETNAMDQTITTLQELIQNASRNVHGLSTSERRRLVEFWVQEIHENKTDELFEMVKDSYAIHKEQEYIHDEVDRRVLQTADVIGVTTTGLAKRISVLQRVHCKVIIYEEAGEVMEPHIISALLPRVEHFIQIGDHQQLRPQINNHGLSLESKQGTPYQLDRSQFERLSVGEPGRPPFPVAQLNVQRRMRPEISTLIRATIYPRLIDHETTKKLPDVVGMRKNVFWLDHQNMEESPDADRHQKSRSNDWEVDMTYALVRHIVRQGVYNSSDIAVLTPYTGQLQKLRTKMRGDFEIVLSDRDEETLARDGFNEDTAATEEAQTSSGNRRKPLEKKKLSELLRIATVDNFQGENVPRSAVDLLVLAIIPVEAHAMMAQIVGSVLLPARFVVLTLDVHYVVTNLVHRVCGEVCAAALVSAAASAMPLAIPLKPLPSEVWHPARTEWPEWRKFSYMFDEKHLRHAAKIQTDLSWAELASGPNSILMTTRKQGFAVERCLALLTHPEPKDPKPTIFLSANLEPPAARSILFWWLPAPMVLNEEGPGHASYGRGCHLEIRQSSAFGSKEPAAEFSPPIIHVTYPRQSGAFFGQVWFHTLHTLDAQCKYTITTTS